MKNQDNQQSNFALTKKNYRLLLIGFGIIIFGFILLAGGGADSPESFSEDIFSSRRIVIAPIVILIGFIFEIYAIMKKTEEN